MGNISSIQEDFGLIIIGAIIFTVSFMWKDLLSDIRESFFPRNRGLIGRIIFTLFITFILLISVVRLRTIFGLSGSSESPITFDDSPLDDNNNLSIDSDLSMNDS